MASLGVRRLDRGGLFPTDNVGYAALVNDAEGKQMRLLHTYYVPHDDVDAGFNEGKLLLAISKGWIKS